MSVLIMREKVISSMMHMAVDKGAEISVKMSAGELLNVNVCVCVCMCTCMHACVCLCM